MSTTLTTLLPHIPLLIKTAILHGLHLSPGSGKQDLRTELTVTLIRSIMEQPLQPIGKQQRASMRETGLQGPLWVSKVVLPAPEPDVRDAVVRAIEALKVGDETFDIPAVLPVEAEWTGYRSGVSKNAPWPDLSDEEKYKALKDETTTDTVILYFHGGAHFLMDPSTHRVSVSRLSKETGAPVLSVRYRLSPQNPFPAAIVDALVAYLSLVSPPPGSFHTAVPANKIVLAGDSAGGNLALGLLQTLLTLRRIGEGGASVQFHGKQVPIDLPEGAALTSPWCDISRSMPSVSSNAYLDYLPPPTQPSDAPYLPAPVPADEVWPCSPPRVDMYTNATAVIHPLASPVAAHTELWKTCPPVFISMGEEELADEGLVLARRMHGAGVAVCVEQFEGMPHCFGLVMQGTRGSDRYFEGCASFYRDLAAGKVVAAAGEAAEQDSSAGRRTGCVDFIEFRHQKTTKVTPLDKVELPSDEKVDKLLRNAKHWRVEGEKELQK